MTEHKIESISLIKHNFACCQAARDCVRMTLVKQHDSTHLLSGWLSHCLQGEGNTKKITMTKFTLGGHVDQVDGWRCNWHKACKKMLKTDKTCPAHT